MSIRESFARMILGRKNNPTAQLLLMGLDKNGLWSSKGYKTLAEAAYKNCMAAFACISKVAENAAGINWKVMGAKGEAVDNHPALALLNRPNRQGKRSFIIENISHLQLAGESFILQSSGLRPEYLYNLRPDRVKVLPGTGPELVRGYRFQTDASNGKYQDYGLDDVLQIKFFNPLDDFRGMGPTEVAGKGIDIDNYSKSWNAANLKNDMRPSGAFIAEGMLQKDQVEDMKSQIKEKYQGYSNAGVPLLLYGGLKFNPLSMSPKEMDWQNGDKANLRSICITYGVPSQLMGDTESTTYSNYQEARKALYTEKVIPLMQFWTDALDSWLMPLFGSKDKLVIDLENIDALQENRGDKFRYINESNFLTVNEKRKALGMEPLGKDGDVVLVSVALVPLGEAGLPEPVKGPEALPEEDEEDNDGNGKSRRVKAVKEHFWAAPERKLKHWQQFALRVKARERSFEHIAKEFLRRQADTVSEAVASVSGLAGLKASDLLDVKKETRRYESLFQAWYMDHFARAHEAGLRASKCELFDDADGKAATSWVNSMTAAQRKKLKEMVHESGTKVNETALDKIEGLITQANDKNWTVNELADRIADNVGDWDKWRAQLWARTESVKVDNFGQLEGFKDTEFVTEKEWLNAQVPDSRDTHIEADGQRVKLDDDFIIDGVAMAYPGDPRGGAGNTCNCLCDMLPIVGE